MDGRSQDQLQEQQAQQPNHPVPGFANVLDHENDEPQSQDQPQEQLQQLDPIHRHRRLSVAELQTLMSLALEHELPRKKGQHGVRREWAKVAEAFSRQCPSQPPLSAKAIQVRV